jgi:DHA1 family bicyclomycin/chloramphenicol resistance-like MFS transporter
MGNALCFGLFFGAVFSYIAGSPYIFEEIFGVSPQLFGALFGLNAAGMVIVSQIGRRLVARTGPARLLTAGLIAGAAAGVAVLVLVLAGAGILPVAACFFVLFASFGVVAPNSTALALEGFPHVAGTASALLGAIQFAIGASVAPLVGVAGTGTAVPVAVLIALFTAAAAVARRLVATRPATHTEAA